MSNGVMLEVIGGPMDGLRGLIVGQGTVGRKVGNSLSLALDDVVSGRHAEIVREGHDWCVRDLKSTNGTFLMNEKLQAGRSYPLKLNDVLLVGSTILQISPGIEGKEHVCFSDSSFNDPRTQFMMTSGLKEVWDHLFHSIEIEHIVNRYFCDVDRLFISIMEVAGEESHAGYECISRIDSPGRYQILAKWLAQVPVGNSFSSDTGSLTVAPRVWKVMNLAADRKKEAIGIGDILGAMLEEGGSLAARYMRKDKLFMEDFSMKLRRGASDETVMDIIRTVKKGRALPLSSESIKNTDGQQPATALIGTPLPSVTPGLDDTWKVFGQRLERLVSGFLADAINPVASQQDFRPPGLDTKFDEMFAARTEDSNLLNQKVKKHLDALYNLLVIILASQRDGYKEFGNYFCTMLESTASEIKNGRPLILPIGKKSVDIEELMVKVKAMLRRMESEGVSETIVRDIIKKKIQQLGV
jgi:pSer/pThr/pTyr-binding forkhead associated (FHA) protein